MSKTQRPNNIRSAADAFFNRELGRQTLYPSELTEEREGYDEIPEETREEEEFFLKRPKKEGETGSSQVFDEAPAKEKLGRLGRTAARGVGSVADIPFLLPNAAYYVATGEKGLTPGEDYATQAYDYLTDGDYQPQTAAQERRESYATIPAQMLGGTGVGMGLARLSKGLKSPAMQNLLKKAAKMYALGMEPTPANLAGTAAGVTAMEEASESLPDTPLGRLGALGAAGATHGATRGALRKTGQVAREGVKGGRERYERYQDVGMDPLLADILEPGMAKKSTAATEKSLEKVPGTGLIKSRQKQAERAADILGADKKISPYEMGEIAREGAEKSRKKYWETGEQKREDFLENLRGTAEEGASGNYWKNLPDIIKKIKQGKSLTVAEAQEYQQATAGKGLFDHLEDKRFSPEVATVKILGENVPIATGESPSAGTGMNVIPNNLVKLFQQTKWGGQRKAVAPYLKEFQSMMEEHGGVAPADALMDMRAELNRALDERQPQTLQKGMRRKLANAITQDLEDHSKKVGAEESFKDYNKFYREAFDLDEGPLKSLEDLRARGFPAGDVYNRLISRGKKGSVVLDEVLKELSKKDQQKLLGRMFFDMGETSTDPTSGFNVVLWANKFEKLDPKIQKKLAKTWANAYDASPKDLENLATIAQDIKFSRGEANFSKTSQHEWMNRMGGRLTALAMGSAAAASKLPAVLTGWGLSVLGAQAMKNPKAVKAFAYGLKSDKPGQIPILFNKLSKVPGIPKDKIRRLRNLWYDTQEVRRARQTNRWDARAERAYENLRSGLAWIQEQSPTYDEEDEGAEAPLGSI